MSADPVTLEVLKIGELAVYAAVNALCAERILPQSFRPVILLPPGSGEERLREIMDQICRVCVAEGLVIEGGHTEVTPAVNRPVVIGSCTGVPMECMSDKNASEDYLSVQKEAQICAEEGAECLVDLSEGGIHAALWRLSVKCRCGFRVDTAAIPMLQETIEFANYYDIDPYKMRSAGSLLAVTKDAEALIGRLEGSGIPAVRIGELTEDHDKILKNDDEIRYLDLPQTDELLKIMERR